MNMRRFVPNAVALRTEPVEKIAQLFELMVKYLQMALFCEILSCLETVKKRYYSNNIFSEEFTIMAQILP